VPGISAAPSISNVGDQITALTPGHFQVQFLIRMTGDPAAGMQEVWITYTDLTASLPRAWQPVDLLQDAADSTLWKGTLNTDHPESIRYSVTAANGVGLTTQDTKLGFFYTPRQQNQQPDLTTLTIGPVGSPLRYADAVSLSATLTKTRNSESLPSQVVTFGFGSQRVQAVTDASGTATTQMTLLAAPGEDYRLQATFSGTDDLSPSSATSSPLTVEKQNVEITLLSQDSTVLATLNDLSQNHHPLSERTIFFVLSSIPNGTVLHTKPVITDFAGQAPLGSIPLPAGTYDLTALFGGTIPLPGGDLIQVSDTNYNSASASMTVDFQAAQATVTYIGDTAVPVGTPVHLAAKVTATGDLTLATVQFTISDASGHLLNAPILSSVAADGFASAAFVGPTGVYQLEVAVVGAAYTATPIFVTVVVFNRTAGFVTGGGWIDSPLGAYSPDPKFNGRATLAFNAKYLDGKPAPDGNTQIQLKGPKFNFSSSAYQWLVVTGGRAEYMGTGTINGSGTYGFLLTAVDGGFNGGAGADKIRVKVWNLLTGAVVYDTQMGAPDGAEPSTVLGAGSIAIHK
jgi:hypothetical protein